MHKRDFIAEDQTIIGEMGLRERKSWILDLSCSSVAKIHGHPSKTKLFLCITFIASLERFADSQRVDNLLHCPAALSECGNRMTSAENIDLNGNARPAPSPSFQVRGLTIRENNTLFCRSLGGKKMSLHQLSPGRCPPQPLSWLLKLAVTPTSAQWQAQSDTWLGRGRISNKMFLQIFLQSTVKTTLSEA